MRSGRELIRELCNRVAPDLREDFERIFSQLDVTRGWTQASSSDPRFTSITVDSLEISDNLLVGRPVGAKKNLYWDSAVGELLYRHGTTNVNTLSPFQELYNNTLALAASSFDIDLTDYDNFTHLLFLLQARSSETDNEDEVFVQLNGDTGGNYSSQRVIGRSGTPLASGDGTTATQMFPATISAASAPAGAFDSSMFFIPNYQGSNWKAMLGIAQTFDNGAGSQDVFGAASWWEDTDPITSIHVYLQSAANFVAGSNLTVIGMNKVLP